MYFGERAQNCAHDTADSGWLRSRDRSAIDIICAAPNLVSRQVQTHQHAAAASTAATVICAPAARNQTHTAQNASSAHNAT